MDGEFRPAGALRTLLQWFAEHGYAFTFPARTAG